MPSWLDSQKTGYFKQYVQINANSLLASLLCILRHFLSDYVQEVDVASSERRQQEVPFSEKASVNRTNRCFETKPLVDEEKKQYCRSANIYHIQCVEDRLSDPVHIMFHSFFYVIYEA